MLHKIRFELDLETCCVGDLCTLNRNGVPWPIIYGMGVNVKTGDIFPAQFTDKGPDMDLRHARTLTGGDNVGVNMFDLLHTFLKECHFLLHQDFEVFLTAKEKGDHAIQYFLTASECFQLSKSLFFDSEQCSNCGNKKYQNNLAVHDFLRS